MGRSLFPSNERAAVTESSLHATLSATDRTRHRRLRERGGLERSDLDAVLRAGFVCHLGVIVDGDPMVVPTVYGADDRDLYFHGSVASRSLVASPGSTVCVTVTPWTVSSSPGRCSSTASTTAAR